MTPRPPPPLLASHPFFRDATPVAPPSHHTYPLVHDAMPVAPPSHVAHPRSSTTPRLLPLLPMSPTHSSMTPRPSPLERRAGPRNVSLVYAQWSKRLWHVAQCVNYMWACSPFVHSLPPCLPSMDDTKEPRAVVPLQVLSVVISLTLARLHPHTARHILKRSIDLLPLKCPLLTLPSPAASAQSAQRLLIVLRAH